MKIEYLAEGPLIRLYAFDQPEVRLLRELVRSLVTGDRHSVVLQNEEWTEPVGGCCLNLRRGDRDQGVRQVQSLNFECILSPDGWWNVEGLLEPFCDSNPAGFQWLANHGKVGLLISQSGQW
jgi:hypothetical protein